MGLDLTKLVSQIGEMVARLQSGRREQQEHLAQALETLHAYSDRFGELGEKIARSRTTWLVAGLVEGLDRHEEPPPLPEDFTILACDGSHIDVDRHRSMRCYLINLGTVVLRYGSAPEAVLESIPRLYADAYWLTERVSAERKPARCVPPSMVFMLLAKL